MTWFRKIILLLKEIGLANLAAFAFYRLQLRSGIMRWRTPAGGWRRLEQFPSFDPPFRLPDRDTLAKFQQPDDKEKIALLMRGLYRPFGGEYKPLSTLPPPGELKHWTAYSNVVNGVDIKTTWEPARFSWALELARWYRMTGDGSAAEFFWEKVEEFNAGNPVNCGPNWSSAQEVAIRFISWLIGLSAFIDAPATTPARMDIILDSLWQHTRRILPTLNYARSQNNNHILSEALALILAGDLFKAVTPEAEKWARIGVREFERALLVQIDDEGNYSQHSANYHRLLLQLALIYVAHCKKVGHVLPGEVQRKLSLATRWLVAQLDPVSGRLPNLGHNDGALILPFGCREQRDYRPTAQAAARGFLDTPCLSAGYWDELTTWLDLEISDLRDNSHASSAAVHKLFTGDTWATLRGVTFRGRPAHADQLHVELWWQGENLAMDPGTYMYNAAPPWQNPLDSTRVHNTVTVDRNDQMQRISRFLWLDQAQATWVEESPGILTASHNGYRKSGADHTRTLELAQANRFIITDLLTVSRENNRHTYTIHWLMPDWEWSLQNDSFVISGRGRVASLKIIASNTRSSEPISVEDVSVIRAGETLVGKTHDPVLGWASDTYSEKHPVLSVSYTFSTSDSIKIISEWVLYNE